MSFRPIASLFLALLLAGISLPTTSAYADPAGSIAADTPRDQTAADTTSIPFAELLRQSAPVDVAEADEGERYVGGEVLVTLAPQSSADEAEAALSDAGVVPIDAMSDETIASQTPVSVAIEDGQSVAQKIDNLMASGAVSYAQPNYLYELDYTPNDPLLKQEKSRWWHLGDINAFKAWDLAKVGKAVRVATLDSGVKTDHLDLVGTLDLDDAYNTVTDTRGAAGATDTEGHGTHVAGIIAAQADNALGTAGVSFNAEVVPINVVYPHGVNVGKSTTGELVEALQYIMDLGDIRVVNISMGTYRYDSALEVAIDAATAQGILVVCAGGNEAQTSPSYPADFDSALSVTWYDSSGSIDSLSDTGEGKNIAAPGRSIYSTVSTGVDSYSSKSGSSMASPVVAGICALVLSVNPDLSVDQVKRILYETAREAGTPGWDPVFGWGKVDAYAAVTEAMGTNVLSSTELSGGDRVATSIAIARQAYPVGPAGVIVVRSDDFPDALAASALAGIKRYPIISCSRTELSSSVRAYLASTSSIKEAILVGGSSSLAPEVKKSVEKLVTSTYRIEGVDRYDTARLLRKAALAAGAVSKTAIIARGDAFPDALSISPYCAAVGAPLFLLSPNAVPDAAMIAELRRYSRVLVVGGFESVSNKVESTLQGYPIEVRRLAGGIGNTYSENRYGTSAAIASWIVTQSNAGFSYNNAALATGLNFPDALAGGPLCASNKAPMLLVDRESYDAVRVAAASNQVSHVYWLGSTSTLSSSIREVTSAHFIT